MPEDLPIRVPLEYVNDDTVKFLRWLVEDGQEVHEGQTLAEVETSKALLELAATANGRVWQRTKPGDELRVGEIVGYISANGNSRPRFDYPTVVTADPETASADTKVRLPTDVRFSKKALELLEAHALSPELFRGQGLVREQDVLEHIKLWREKERPASNVHFALDEIPLDRISLPSLFHDLERGHVDPGFLSHLQNEWASFARLSSAEKCEAYRRNGAVVGDGAALDDGTVIIAPQIVIGERVQIGQNSSIQCRERFLVGQFSSFRSGLSVRGGTVVLGENVFAGRNIQIGGGGHGDPHSLLSVGDGTYLGDDIFVNICRPVLIGKEVFVTQRSILVTHNIGHSILEGYENRFAPILLEDYAQVGMNSTIYAGSRIGRGSIVMSNSYVISSIPPGKMAAGVPARVIRDATRSLDRKQQVNIVHGMMRDYNELLARKGYAASPLQMDPFPSFKVQHKDKRFQLLFLENYCDASAVPEPLDESILWTLENSCKGPQRDFAVMELLAKKITGSTGIFAEATREFLRKRGIRLEPGPWRYQGGFI